MDVNRKILKDLKGMLTNLEALVCPSQTYCKVIQQYPDFFTSIFGNELLSFGYEKLNKNGFYEGISNKPRIAEIFIETKAYQVMPLITKQFFSVEHGFIYQNESADQSIYNKFRIQLDKELGLYATFYALETCLNYQNIFVWNFRAPLKASSLTKWENQILLCFINNRKSIQYVRDQFKKFYYQTISKKVVPIKLLNPTIEKKETKSTSTLGERLVGTNWLAKKDLYFKDLDLSNKEALCAYFYLQGMSAKEIAGKMFVSRRTVEDYIRRIKQKLKVKSRSEFHAAMNKVNLWRNTL